MLGRRRVFKQAFTIAQSLVIAMLFAAAYGQTASAKAKNTKVVAVTAALENWLNRERG